jgi:cytochrome bd-type quinol oxidase subunit 1
MLIAVVAVLHVLVSFYAVGGGLFLAYETTYAYRSGNAAYLDYLRRHARFFVVLTVVYGAVTGVGIWWTIGLASPLATQVLIHTFLFAWATEYVFFVLEVVSAFAFYYYWGRLSPSAHQAVGWIYAFAAWMSLVLITGITAFMLNPGDWTERLDFWSAFFNPQFVPQTVARSGGSLVLATLYVYLHAAFTVKDDSLRGVIEFRSARPALLGAVLIVAGGIGWLAFLPPSAQAALAAASTLNILTVLIFAVTAGIFALLYVGPYRNPGWLSPGFALVLFVLGLSAVGTGEFIREAVRKPYVIYNVVLGNQITVDQVDQLRRTGYLDGGIWTRAYVAANYPQVMKGGHVDQNEILKLPESDQVRLGELIFQYHCNDCHSPQGGYSAVDQLMVGWTPEMVGLMVRNLEKGRFFMPPWAGTDAEAQLITKYLLTIAPPRPPGMR